MESRRCNYLDVVIQPETVDRGAWQANAPLDVSDYAWSADGARLLVFTNTRKVWRQNTRGDYWTYRRSTGQLESFPN